MKKMMQERFKKQFIFTGIASAFLLAACGSAEATDEEATANPDAETIIVGTGNAYQPFVYLDENEDLQGYDIEVLRAVDEKLDQYNFEYESMDFKNILTSLSADKVQLAAHNYAYNDERGAKYLYGEEAYNNYAHHIVADESTGQVYQSLEDLKGKKVFASPASEVANILETYNAENDDAIEIVYSEVNGELLVSGLQNGTADAAILTKFDVDKYNEQFDINLQASDEALKSAGIYYVFQQGDEALQTAVDGAIKELRQEGTLSELSIEILGADYTE
ncbi:transporter substrate-binding domain-containing protein [Aerococcus viridans]|uniref:L-cystine-binding protein TcyK n=1 Tax=Aerococcus viridans TaxID=1377 RepID=A0A2J9PL63_9LACT|nr:transporter substrate-binding domain-containing protein [Aerococcus viridans]MCT1797977.1 transporter substrate-binding domain-containing protein [Aerococcus viridans]PNL91093.1 L-cystine-binding protein TcyK [Aerococcus viridans]